MASATENPDTESEAPPIGAKIAFLSSPRAYPDGGPVEARETHMAWVFLAGDRVYKIKKPVRYPFLDYSTLAARREVCEAEVRLNRRLAPDVYLGVARLTLESGGALALDGPGRVVEWVVVMRRLPETSMLDIAIRAGTVTRDQVEAVAARLAAFYRAAAPVEVGAAGHVGRFIRELEENGRVFGLRAFDAVGTRGTVVSAALQALLARDPEILASRVRAGRIVEGHGDLRPEHVCLSDPPVIIDCLEFSRDLRLVDPFDELSFLGMECAALGAPWIGPQVTTRCAALIGDRPSGRLLGFYTAYRACFRARQALAHLLEPDPRTPAKWVPLACDYLDRADEAMVSLGLPEARPARRPHGGGG